jgi:CheY-like chemotaxis protein
MQESSSLERKSPMKSVVLITDANAELCRIYRYFLTKHGYEVETSADGLECLSKLRQAKPAVLVLDVELRWGGSDGVLAWLREESPTLGVPVILTGTRYSPQLLSELGGPPVVHCLRKPFALAALLESIGSAVATSSASLSPIPSG